MVRKHWLLAALLAIAAGLVACGPTITVQNETQIPVRAIVRSGETTQMLSPSPGESSSAEVQTGAYRVTVIPDTEWINYAKDVRKFLNDQLANSENLTGPQLLEVIRRLKEIAQRMQQFEQAAASSGSCAGNLTDDQGGAIATVTIGASGALAITCR